MVSRVYTASLSCSTLMKKQQQEVMHYLEAHNIEYEVVDITMSEEKRQWMYKNIPKNKWPECGNPLPPQIFFDDTYCGICAQLGDPTQFCTGCSLWNQEIWRRENSAARKTKNDYNDFFEAKESNAVSSFLRIKSKSSSRKEEM